MIWLFIGVAALIVLLVLGVAYRVVTAIIGHAIGPRHRVLECVLESGAPHSSWVEGRQTDAERTRRRCLNRLDGLVAYVRRTQLVADEPTRQELLARLASIRARWHEPDWYRLLEQTQRADATPKPSGWAARWSAPGPARKSRDRQGD